MHGHRNIKRYNFVWLSGNLSPVAAIHTPTNLLFYYSLRGILDVTVSLRIEAKHLEI